jgi:hypothetical protein
MRRNEHGCFHWADGVQIHGVNEVWLTVRPVPKPKIVANLTL